MNNNVSIASSASHLRCLDDWFFLKAVLAISLEETFLGVNRIVLKRKMDLGAIKREKVIQKLPQSSFQSLS